MKQHIHILNQLGVLVSFSVAKKITDAEIKKHSDKHKKSGKSKAEIDKLIQNRFLLEIKKAIENKEIPGLIESTNILGPDQIDAGKIKSLNNFINMVSNKLNEERFSKDTLCYFIDTLVKIMELSHKDFDEFHRRNADEEDDESDNEDGPEPLNS